MNTGTMADAAATSTTLTALLPLIGAAIGATGAVSAQFVVAFFTSKRERRRLDFEIAQVEADSSRARIERFSDQKRELFSVFIRTIRKARHELGIAHGFVKKPTSFDKSIAAFNELAQELAEHLVDLELLDPAVSLSCRKAVGLLLEAAEAVDDATRPFDPEVFARLEKYSDSLNECFRAMHVSLGVAPEPV